MKYKLKNSGITFSLTSKDWVAEGGEGTIYVRGDTAYKICFPGKMVPPGKIQELSLLTEPFVIKPENIITDERDKDIGYTMRFLKPADYLALPTLFTNTFKTREGISDKQIMDLVVKFQNNIKYVHSNKILLVDLNEFNFLATKDLTDVVFIDVNSWQTPNYPATAIMDSIRDWTANRFNELTDWYSFAIISFQLLTGLHPFRSGNHASYAHGTLDEKAKARAIANVSVLNQAVRFPKAAARPFTVIPPVYLNWYNAIFEKGLRLPPPDKITLGGSAGIIINQVYDTLLKITEVFRADNIINRFEFVGGRRIIITNRSIFVDDLRLDKLVPTNNLFIKNGILYSAAIDPRGLTVYNALRQEAVASYQASIKGLYLNSEVDGLYGQVGDRIFNFKLQQVGSSLKILPYEVAQTMENSTFIGDGVAIQNMMGTNYLHYLTTSGSMQVRLRELDKQRIQQAALRGANLTVISKDSRKQLNYNRFDIKADGSYTCVESYNNIANWSLQAERLDNGLYLEIQEDGSLKISSGSKAKLIKDTFLEDSYLLATKSDEVFVARGNTVFQIKVK